MCSIAPLLNLLASGVSSAKHEQGHLVPLVSKDFGSETEDHFGPKNIIPNFGSFFVMD